MDDREQSDTGDSPASEGADDNLVERIDPVVEGAPIRTPEPRPSAAATPEPRPGRPSATTPDGPDAWVGAATAAGLGLMAVEAAVLLGTLVQGITVERFEGDALHRLGVAFLSNIGTANGLTILVAALLAALPALVRAPLTESQDRRRASALTIGAFLALLVVLATPLAVRARLHVLDLNDQPVDSLARSVLATYTAGTLGTAAVALGACLGLSRVGRSRTAAHDDHPA